MLQPPYFMTKDVMAGVAQLEQFDEELYKVRWGGVRAVVVQRSEGVDRARRPCTERDKQCATCR